IAATTFGWQCPVEHTAIPAAKSRKALPSTSSTIAPCPRLATSGYSRVYDGDMNLASCSSTRLAFGPGSAVTSRGVFISKVVGISSSREETMWLELIRNYGRKSRRANGTNPGVACGEKENLVSLRRRVLAAGRPAGNARGNGRCEFED